MKARSLHSIVVVSYMRAILCVCVVVSLPEQQRLGYTCSAELVYYEWVGILEFVPLLYIYAIK